MDEVHYRIEHSDIQWYTRPAFGYQVIVFVQQGISRCRQEGKYLGIHPTLSSVFEYQYGSRYSYPARDEAEARQMAMMYCMTAAADHWSRMGTRLDARIYPFAGLIGAMRLVPRKARGSRHA